MVVAVGQTADATSRSSMASEDSSWRKRMSAPGLDGNLVN